MLEGRFASFAEKNINKGGLSQVKSRSDDSILLTLNSQKQTSVTIKAKDLGPVLNRASVFSSIQEE